MLFILTGLALQYGESALWVASEAGGTECVKLLLKHGAQVDLPVRCDGQKWIQGCGVLFGKTGQCGWVVFDTGWKGHCKPHPFLHVYV